MTRYCDDGAIEIDNWRGVLCTLGKKDFLFSEADPGAECTATMYSLIGMTKLNGMNPEAYLGNVLGRIAEHPINRINDLLPWIVAGDLPSVIANA